MARSIPLDFASAERRFHMLRDPSLYYLAISACTPKVVAINPTLLFDLPHH